MKKNILAIAFTLCLCCIFAVMAGVSTNVSALTSSSGGDIEELNEGISLSKTVTANYPEEGDFEYVLRLETFTTGTVTTVESVTTPADIVLVLDQSTSMMWPLDQQENLTYADAYVANNTSGSNGTTSLTNNYGIIDGYYEEQDVDIDGEDGEKTEKQYVWTAYDTSSVNVDKINGDWVSSSADNSTTVAALLADNNNTWNDYCKVNYGYLYSESRQKVLIDSVLDFIYALDKTAGHRIAIVTYHNNTPTTTLVEVNEGNYQTIAAGVVSWVTTENTGSYSANTTCTFNLQHNTQICEGVSMAESILATAKYNGISNYNSVVTSATLKDEYNDSGRTQLAVIFTDGIPTADDDSSTVGNVGSSLADAQDMKQNGVTVFSIGMLDGVYSDVTGSTASTTNPYKAVNTSNATSTYYADRSVTSSGANRTTTYYVTYGSSFISSFLDLLSSNYADASSYISSSFPNSSGLYDVGTESTTYSISNTYDKTVVGSNADGSAIYSEYFYAIDTSSNVNVAATLNSIFETVAGEMTGSATYELDETAQVRDVMSSEFEIPVRFNTVGANNGDYALCSTTGVYYYVGDGKGSYDIDIAIDLYVAYCTGENGAEDADTDMHNSGYYTWSDDNLVYSTAGKTLDDSTSFSGLSVFVRTAFIDIREGHETTVYYYSDYTAGTILYAAESDDGANDGYFYIMYGDEAVTLYETQTVIVEGFDYNSYYVTTRDSDNGLLDEPSGAKLIIEFEIEVDTQSVTAEGGDSTGDTSSDGSTGTFGGNGVNTNTAASGIYILETVGNEEFYQMLEAFPVPNADIEITIDLSVSNQTIYLGNSVSIPDLLTIGSSAIDGVNNAFVNITFYIYEDSDGDGEVEGNEYNTPVLTVYIPAGEPASEYATAENLIMPQSTTTYVISVEVVPEVDGVVTTEVHISDQFSVYVLYPDIQTNSIWVDYGTPVILREDNVVKPFDADFFDTNQVTWEHSEVLYSYIEDGSGAYNLDTDSEIEFTYISADGGQYNLITNISENYNDGVAIFGTYSLCNADGYLYRGEVSFDDDGYLSTELGTGIYAVQDDEGDYTFEYVGAGNGGHFNLTTATYEEATGTDGYYDLISIPAPNQDTPPTVIFGYTGGCGVEYTSAEYESYGAREDNEFYISSMTITSSDGYETVTRYDIPEENYEYFSVNINRFDLEISKLVVAADYDLYPQSFVFDIAFTGSAFETQQKISLSSDDLVEYTDTDGNAVYWQPASKTSDDEDVDVTDGTLYNSASDDDDIHEAYDAGSYTVSDTIGYDDYYYYKTGFHYDLPDTITVNDTDYYLVYLYEDEDGDTPVMGTSLVADVDKVVQLVMEEDKTGITKTTVWINDETSVEYSGTPEDTAGYTKYYKFTGKVVDLYCGLEITVTEDTDWSWRYTPGFEINQVTEDLQDEVEADAQAIISAVAATLAELSADDLAIIKAALDMTGTTDAEFIESFESMSDADAIAAIEAFLGITFDTTYYYESTWETEIDGSTTYTRTNDILALRIKSYDEYFDANGDVMTLWGVNYNDYDNLDISYYTNAVASGFDNETVADVTISEDKDEAVIFVSNSSYYLDYNGDRTNISGFTRWTKTINVDVDGDGEIAGDESETFTIYTNPPASPFTIYSLYMDVINKLDDDQWLSYGTWTDNKFDALTIGGEQ